MSNPSFPILLSLAIATLSVTGNAMGAERGDDPRSCAGVIDPGARLACYDKVFPPAAEARSFADEVEAKRRKSAEDFGLSKQQLVSEDTERGENDPARVEGTVVSVVERSTGERVVTLDNKQVWLLTEVTSRGRLVGGDKVTLRKAALGSYMLLTEKRIPLRARRLR